MNFSIRDLFAPKEPSFRIAECADGMYRVQVKGTIKYEKVYCGDNWHTIRIRMQNYNDEGRQYGVYETLQQATAFKAKVMAYERNEKESNRLANTVVKVY